MFVFFTVELLKNLFSYLCCCWFSESSAVIDPLEHFGRKKDCAKLKKNVSLDLHSLPVHVLWFFAWTRYTGTIAAVPHCSSLHFGVSCYTFSSLRPNLFLLQCSFLTKAVDLGSQLNLINMSLIYPIIQSLYVCVADYFFSCIFSFYILSEK